MTQKNRPEVSEGDFIRVIEMSELDYFEQMNGGEPIYGYVKNGNGPTIKIVARIGTKVHYFCVDELEIVHRASDEESPEVTKWKKDLYEALLGAERSEKWCKRWREHAPTFGFGAAHFPPKRLKVTIYVDSDLTEASDGVAIRDAAEAFASEHGYEFAGGASLVD